MWTAPRSAGGYGWFKLNGTTINAHRAAWILAHGTIADGLCVCHRCDTPACVNVDHLFLGTHADNVRDCINKGRRQVVRGSANPNCRYSDDTISRVRAMRADGMSYRRISASLGISAAQACRVILGRRRSE